MNLKIKTYKILKGSRIQLNLNTIRKLLCWTSHFNFDLIVVYCLKFHNVTTLSKNYGIKTVSLFQSFFSSNIQSTDL